MQMNDIQKALDKTKIALMQKPDSMFFTTIVFSLQFKWDDTCQTAYTNGKVLGWNPTWFLQLTQDERVGVMVHEACHVAYDHIARATSLFTDMPAEDQRVHRRIFNDACDHVINLMLLGRGYKLPPGLYDSRFKDMTSEQVYKQLLDEMQQQAQQPCAGAGQGQSGGQGGNEPNPMGGDIRDDHGMSPQQLQTHVQDMLVRAAIQSRMSGDKPGSIPGDIQLFLDKLLNPKLPWQTILRRFINTMSKSDYSFRKPNKRFMPDQIMPTLWSEGLDDLVVFVDISGSVTDSQFKQYVSDIHKVMRSFRPKKITVIQFDTKIIKIDEVKTLHQLRQIEFHGRGGTAVGPIFKWIEKNKPKLSLVFTDGGFHWPDADRAADKIVWLINDNPDWKAPKGRTIHFDTD